MISDALALAHDGTQLLHHPRVDERRQRVGPKIRRPSQRCQASCQRPRPPAAPELELEVGVPAGREQLPGIMQQQRPRRSDGVVEALAPSLLDEEPEGPCKHPVRQALAAHVQEHILDGGGASGGPEGNEGAVVGKLRQLAAVHKMGGEWERVTWASLVRLRVPCRLRG